MTTIERLRKLLAEATPGPWESDDRAHWEGGNEDTRWVCLVRRPSTAGEAVASVYSWSWRGEGAERAVADAALIVAAVNALPALLDALDELLAMISEAYCVLGRFETCGDPFCSEARARRDAILARLDGAS